MNLGLNMNLGYPHPRKIDPHPQKSPSPGICPLKVGIPIPGICLGMGIPGDPQNIPKFEKKIFFSISFFLLIFLFIIFYLFFSVKIGPFFK